MITNIFMKTVCVSLVLAGIGAVAIAATGQITQSPLFSGLAPLTANLTWVIVALALMPVVSTTVRLLLWNQGYGVMCDRCGGPLGREKSGRYSIYRTCMGCGANRNEKHWLTQRGGAP